MHGLSHPSEYVSELCELLVVAPVSHLDARRSKHLASRALLSMPHRLESNAALTRAEAPPQAAGEEAAGGDCTGGGGPACAGGGFYGGGVGRSERAVGD